MAISFCALWTIVFGSSVTSPSMLSKASLEDLRESPKLLDTAARVSPRRRGKNCSVPISKEERGSVVYMSDISSQRRVRYRSPRIKDSYFLRGSFERLAFPPLFTDTAADSAFRRLDKIQEGQYISTTTCGIFYLFYCQGEIAPFSEKDAKGVFNLTNPLIIEAGPF